MECLDVCARSSLYYRQADNMLLRQYHDTHAWSDPFPPLVDDKGVLRCSQNRRLDALHAHQQASFRGTTINGVQKDGERDAPPHVRHALQCLCRDPASVRAFAHLCGGVAVSTAWSYACRVVERWPHAHALGARLVAPALLADVSALDDLTGSLRDVLRRMHVTPELRCVPDLFAQLRLARLCALAAREVGAS